MRILLTNDDGITAPGLAALHRAVSHLGEITVVAPATGQSATSHGVTFHVPLLAKAHRCTLDDGSHLFEGFSVDGRPADCVKLALARLLPKAPDLVISGINAGANIGINVIYSGTVAAAMEAAFMGVPSIAVSLHIGDRNRTRWDLATKHARGVIERVLEAKPERHSVLNVNIPLLDEGDEPRGTRVVPISTSPIVDAYDCADSNCGGKLYKAADHLKFHHTPADSDVDAVFKKYITITPLHFDLTKHEHLDRWTKHLNGAPART
jgi:5'-nucleotidase